MNKIKIFSMIFLFCFILSLTGCFNNSVSSQEELYDIGLDLIETMEEMIQSDEYASIMGTSDFTAMLETVDTNDYDSPVAVYSLTKPDVHELLKLATDYDLDLWDNLSRN